MWRRSNRTSESTAPTPPVTTLVLSGGAVEQAPTVAWSSWGAALRLSDVRVDGAIVYAQHSHRHLLHATLGDRRLPQAARAAPPSTPDARPRPGAISFTPADRERGGCVRGRAILGLEIAFEEGFIEEASERRSGAPWRVAFDATDHKALALAQAIAARAAIRSNPLVHDTLLVALARRLAQQHGDAPRRRDDGWLHPRALVRVVDRLQADPARSITLEELAREAGLGVSAFLRAFRGAVGRTPAAFALALRLDHAAGLLRETRLPVGGIAAAAGFSSPSHLVRAFRHSRGVTPAQWRRLLRD